MTNNRLSQSYLKKAAIRLKTLRFMHNEAGYSDVVREAQECVELLLKGLLRHLGIEVPKTHDVSSVLRIHQDKMPDIIQKNLNEITIISRTLRKERELAFYGAEDWIPTDEYSEVDSSEAILKAERIFELVSSVLI